MKRYSLIAVAALLALRVGSPWSAAADGEAGEPDLRAQLDRWVQTKQLLSQEKQQWRLERELIADRISLLAQEAEALREKSRRAREGIGETEAKLVELRKERDALKTATAGLDTAATGAEQRVLALLARAPAPIRERVRPLSQSIPKNPADTKMSLSQRFQNVIGILNEINKFAASVTVASEVRELGEDTSAEVTTLYAGMSQAYYCNANGGLGGYGRPGTNGWEWTQANGIAAAVADVVAIYRNERAAGYVALPFGDAGAAAAVAATPGRSDNTE